MKQIELPPRGLETLFGVHDQNIKYLESLLDVQINGRGHSLNVDGDPKDVETVERKILDAYDAEDPRPLDETTLQLATSLAADHRAGHVR